MRCEDGSIQTDALIDCGNALSELGEVAEQSKVTEILSQAAEAYQTALSRTQDTTVRSLEVWQCRNRLDLLCCST